MRNEENILRNWYYLFCDLSNVDSKILRRRIFVTVLLLVCIGIVMVYSSSFPYAEHTIGNSEYFLVRQVMFSFLGLIALFVGYSLDPEFLRKISRWLMLFSLILLALVLVPGIGQQVGGARRWIRLGWFNFQPSELAQLVLLIYASDFFARKIRERRRILTDLASMFPVFLVFGIMATLILLEPDLGTATVSAAALFCLMWGAGFRLSYVISLILISLPLVSMLVFSSPYRRRRILAFLNPWADPRNTGFQIIQSQIALGSGGWFGKGLGKSIQKLFYLPAAHTDFIFAVIGEELGFVGTFFVLSLFFYLFVQGFAATVRQKDPYRKLLILGITSLLCLETIINLGVNLGLLPPKGLPLPFISYGGSAQIINMFAIGLVLRLV